MNYVVAEIGGRQFIVKKGDVIRVNNFKEPFKKTIKINKILMSSGKKIELGTPYVKGASISCDLIREGKGKKVIVFKYKRRKNKKFKRGHRQKFVELEVKEIDVE